MVGVCIKFNVRIRFGTEVRLIVMVGVRCFLRVRVWFSGISMMRISVGLELILDSGFMSGLDLGL